MTKKSLDLEAIAEIARTATENDDEDVEDDVAWDMCSFYVPALIAEVQKLRTQLQPYVKEGIQFCAVCGTALGDEEDVTWEEEGED
jgi:hypothetical protein